MQIIDMVVAEMHVNIDLKLTEIIKLKAAMDNCTVSYNSLNPDEVEYYATFMEFYEMLKGMIEGAENVSDS